MTLALLFAAVALPVPEPLFRNLGPETRNKVDSMGLFTEDIRLASIKLRRMAECESGDRPSGLGFERCPTCERR